MSRGEPCSSSLHRNFEILKDACYLDIRILIHGLDSEYIFNRNAEFTAWILNLELDHSSILADYLSASAVPHTSTNLLERGRR